MIFDLQELYGYFQHVNQPSTAAEDQTPQPEPLSPRCQEWLSSQILYTPRLGHSILHSLLFPSGHQHRQCNLYLHLLHLRCLNSLLLQLTVSNERNPEAAESVEESSLTELTEKFYTLLALFDPDAESVQKLPLSTFLGSLAKCLSDTATSISSGPLKKESVISTFLGRGHPNLLKLYFKEEWKLRKLGYSFASVSVSDGATQSGWLLSNLLGSKDRIQIWRDLYLLSCQKKRHFLDMIMVSTKVKF